MSIICRMLQIGKNSCLDEPYSSFLANKFMNQRKVFGIILQCR